MCEKLNFACFFAFVIVFFFVVVRGRGRNRHSVAVTKESKTEKCGKTVYKQTFNSTAVYMAKVF